MYNEKIKGITVCNPVDIDKDYLLFTVDYAAKMGFNHMQIVGPIHNAVKGNIDGMTLYIALGAYKVQLFKPYFNQASIDKAHAHGIRCNVYWADDPEEAKRYFAMGVDTVLTNDYLAISNAVC